MHFWNGLVYVHILTKKEPQKVTKLFSVATFSACQNILDAAEEQGDSTMLTKIRDVDLIAAEAKYHNVCKSIYTAKRNMSYKSYKESVDEDLYSEAFNELVTEITPGINDGKAFTMTYLLCQFKFLLEEKKICADNYRSHRLKSRLQNHFKDSIVFHQQPNPSKPELVYSSDISLQDVINASAKVCSKSQETDAFKNKKLGDSNTPKQILYHASQILKADLQNSQGIDMKPVDIDDLTLTSTDTALTHGAVG